MVFDAAYWLEIKFAVQAFYSNTNYLCLCNSRVVKHTFQLASTHRHVHLHTTSYVIICEKIQNHRFLFIFVVHFKRSILK